MTKEQFITAVRTEQEGFRRFLLALCGGDMQRADDLAQDALVKAYIASSGFVPHSKFSSWLYKIGYNCFIDSTRIHSPKPASEKEIQNAAAEDRSDNVFLYQDLYDAIDSLSAGEKAAILLFYLEERPIKEISDILNIPQGTVKSLLSRGREHLRKRIEQ